MSEAQPSQGRGRRGRGRGSKSRPHGQPHGHGHGHGHTAAQRSPKARHSRGGKSAPSSSSSAAVAAHPPAHGSPPRTAKQVPSDVEPPSPATAAVRSLAERYHQPAEIVNALMTGELSVDEVVKACSRFMTQLEGFELVLQTVVDKALEDRRFRKLAAQVLAGVKDIEVTDASKDKPIKRKADKAVLNLLQFSFQKGKQTASLSVLAELVGLGFFDNLVKSVGDDVCDMLCTFEARPENELLDIVDMFAAAGDKFYFNFKDRCDQGFQQLRELICSGKGTVVQRSCALYILELHAAKWPKPTGQ